MNITSTSESGIELVHINGILDTATSPQAENFINDLLAKGSKKMIINLADTEYMSSSGLRILLATAKKLWADGGKLRIAEANKIVKDILDTSGFSVILEVKDNLDDALADF